MKSDLLGIYFLAMRGEERPHHDDAFFNQYSTREAYKLAQKM